jgi:hypothetical protein
LTVSRAVASFARRIERDFETHFRTMGFLMSDWSGTIYLLCFVASAACAGFLAHAYLRDRMRALLWSAAAFALLAVDNLLAVIDTWFEPVTDFLLYRSLTVLLAVSLVIYGFVWEEA